MPKTGAAIGYDIVGIVEAVGDGLDPARIGERVGALMVDLGACGDLVDIPAEAVVQVPRDVDAAEAVSLFLNYLTAFQMFHRMAVVSSGEKVLVNSAAGGVGSALLELARAPSVKATGSTSVGKHGLVTRSGALPFDYKTQAYDALDTGYDVIFDAVGGPAVGPMYRLLQQGGDTSVTAFSMRTERARWALYLHSCGLDFGVSGPTVVG